jgi:hypothetical protein
MSFVLSWFDGESPHIVEIRLLGGCQLLQSSVCIGSGVGSCLVLVFV